jgi:hypothetical protein
MSADPLPENPLSSDPASLEGHLEKLAQIQVEQERLEADWDEHARPLEQAAHAILKARGAYRRYGQYCRLRELPTERRESFRFHIDDTDGYDFSVDLLPGELLQDSEAVAASTARTKRDEERERLRRQQKATSARLAQLDDERG